MSDAKIIEEQARRIIESGALGRSRSYVRLLEYLVECSERGVRPKEVEIAADVFGKGREFDPNQDAFVRVYVHNLRQKLEKYYAAQPSGDGMRLSIPKGEYRLTVIPTAAAVQAPHVRPSLRRWGIGIGIGIAVLLAINLSVLFLLRGGSTGSGDAQALAQSPLWAELLNDDLPILAVVGDYFIFAELDDFGRVNRLVREFDVNSSGDLDAMFMSDPELLARYMDLDLTYLPQGSAAALSDVLRVVHSADKSVQISTMTELRVADLKTHHIVYVGYISALGTLSDFVFSSSGLRVGASFDELQNVRTGEYFLSGAGIPGTTNYEDYGLLSSFPGPDGNQFLIVAGTRDSGLMHAAHAISTREDVESLEAALAAESAADSAVAFEALYRVTGFDRMNLDAMLVYNSRLDYRSIWGAELSAAQD